MGKRTKKKKQKTTHSSEILKELSLSHAPFKQMKLLLEVKDESLLMQLTPPEKIHIKADSTADFSFTFIHKAWHRYVNYLAFLEDFIRTRYGLRAQLILWYQTFDIIVELHNAAKLPCAHHKAMCDQTWFCIFIFGEDWKF